MSNSPVELLEGWRLNHTRGLSLFATSDEAPPSAVGVSSGAAGVSSGAVPASSGCVVPASVPQATSEKLSIAAIVAKANFFFISFSFLIMRI